MRSAGNPPTCILSDTDHHAVQMAAILANAGINVPGEISFAGVGGNLTDDDYNRYGFEDLRLTHAVEAWESVADEAFDALLARISEPERAPRMILVGASLGVGNSVLRLDP